MCAAFARMNAGEARVQRTKVMDLGIVSLGEVFLNVVVTEPKVSMRSSKRPRDDWCLISRLGHGRD